MIERLIFTALQDGIDELLSDLDRLELFFQTTHCLTHEETAKIRETFENFTPAVQHNYPRADPKFPLFAVVLGNERETSNFLDNTAGFLSSEEAEALESMDLAGADVKTSFYTTDNHIMVLTEHADMTIWYYQIAKYLMTRARNFFQESGVLITAPFNGQDVAPDPRYAPEYMFVRRFTITAIDEQKVIDDVIPRATKVDGVHVAGGSTSSVGNVRTKVTSF